MRRKVNFQFLGIAVLAMITTLMLSVAIFYELFQQQVLEDLKTYADVLKSVVVIHDDLSGGLEQIGNDEVRVMIVQKDGVVVMDNYLAEDTIDNHARRPEIKEAFSEGEGQAIRRSETLDKNTFYYAVLLDNGQVLRVSKEAVSIWSALVGALPKIFIFVFVLFIICIILSRYLSKSLMQPIEQMAKDIDKMEEVRPYEELVPFVQRIQQQHKDIMSNANMRQEFTANVSHELKTPLTSISGYAELIETGIASYTDVGRFAREIHKNSTRLLTLINDIIRLSELDVVDMGVTYQEVNLYQIAENCVEMLQDSAKNHDVILELEGAHYTIMANGQMMDELVYNLCDNAIRYTNPGGRVKVRIGRIDQGIVLSVKDNGIGIPAEHQQRIFERFYRVDKSRSNSAEGTGLGLAIVKHIVAQHNAEIQLLSEPGQGTEIIVTFQ